MVAPATVLTLLLSSVSVPGSGIAVAPIVPPVVMPAPLERTSMLMSLVEVLADTATVPVVMLAALLPLVVSK